MAKLIRENKIQKYDWVIFAHSYFLIARLGCQELLSNSKDKHSKNSSSTLPYQPADLYVSILFNIKHGIEVFIKTLSLFAYGECEEGHDVKILFNTARENILNLELTPRKKGFYDDVTQEHIDESIQDLKKIEQLTLYFYKLEFLKKKLSANFVICDSLNDVLRYPKNKASIRIDWSTVLEQHTQPSDIAEVLEKLEELYGLFNKVSYLHAVLNRAK